MGVYVYTSVRGYYIRRDDVSQLEKVVTPVDMPGKYINPKPAGNLIRLTLAAAAATIAVVIKEREKERWEWLRGRGWDIAAVLLPLC